MTWMPKSPCWEGNCPRRGTVRAAKTAGQGRDDVRVAEWEGEVGLARSVGV